MKGTDTRKADTDMDIWHIPRNMMIVNHIRGSPSSSKPCIHYARIDSEIARTSRGFDGSFGYARRSNNERIVEICCAKLTELEHVQIVWLV